MVDTPAPTHALTETTAPSNGVVPSNAAPTPDTPSLPELPAPPSALLGSASRRRPLPGDDLLVPGAVSTHLNTLVTETVSEARREGSWRVFVRVLGVLLGAVVTLRLVFDDVLPKLLLACVVGAVVLGVVAMVLQAVSEARRQRVLLIALAQVSRMARLDPALRPHLAPQVDAIVAALRTSSRVWPSFFAGPARAATADAPVVAPSVNVHTPP